MTKIHLDTDFGGDIDDICALALLLKCGQADITGITTVAENEGKRAGQVKYTLSLVGRSDIPVKAGADNSGGFYPTYLGLPSEERYWPEPIASVKNSVDAAIELLRQSIDQKATIVAIGPLTNLYLLDARYPGILKDTNIVFMGGFVHAPRRGFPEWTSEHDFNKQIDVRSAKHVLTHSNPTLVQLCVTAETSLRRAHLDRLRAAGALGQLLARQAEAFAQDKKMDEEYGKTCEALPSDIINFQHDPLTAAVALGWNEDIEIQALPLLIQEKDGLLHETIDPNGRLFNVVTRVNGPRFSEFWVDTVAAG